VSKSRREWEIQTGKASVLRKVMGKNTSKNPILGKTKSVSSLNAAISMIEDTKPWIKGGLKQRSINVTYNLGT